MPILENFTPHAREIISPIAGAEAVTPNDSNDLTQVTRSLYVGTTGDLSVVLKSGDTITFANMPVGWHPIRVKRVLATDTTASDIVAGW